MSNIIKNILVGMVFFTGLLTFVFGEFILSSVLFAISATAININKPPKKATAESYQSRNRFSRTV